VVLGYIDMVLSQRWKEKIDEKIIENLGINVTFIKKTQPYYNSRGEKESDTETLSSIKIVPYNVVDPLQERLPFGNFKSGDMVAVVSSDVVMDIDDMFTIDNKNWVIKEIRPNYTPINVGYLVLLVPEHA
jgi:hypothetical protein